MTRTKLCDRILPDYTRGEEIFNMVSHIVGAAFGVVALVAMMPLLSIQAVGFYYEHIARSKKEEPVVYGDYDIIELWEASA